MAEKVQPVIFPLAINPLEQMFFLCDRPGLETAFEFRLVFDQIPDEASWRAALELVAGRHPLLFAEARHGFWQEAEGGPVGLKWECRGREVHFRFRHSHCDGHGAILFLTDCLQAYHELRGGQATAWGPTAPELLQERFLPLSSGKQESASSLGLRLRLAAQFLLQWPAQLSGSPQSGSSLAYREASPELTLDLKQSAQSQQVSLHEWVLAVYLQTLQNWPHRQGRGGIRVLLPVDLRQRKHLRMGASNCLSFAFLSPPQRPDPTYVVQELEFIRKFRPELSTLWGLDWGRRLGLLGPALRWLPCLRNSSTFTYLGQAHARLRLSRYEEEPDVYRIGGQRLERIEGYPPTHAGTPLALALGEMGGCLCLSLRCDPQGPAPHIAEQLLEKLLSDLEQSLDQPAFNRPVGQLR